MRLDQSVTQLVAKLAYCELRESAKAVVECWDCSVKVGEITLRR